MPMKRGLEPPPRRTLVCGATVTAELPPRRRSASDSCERAAMAGRGWLSCDAEQPATSATTRSDLSILCASVSRSCEVVVTKSVTVFVFAHLRENAADDGEGHRHVPGHVCSSSGKCPLGRLQLSGFTRNFGKFAPAGRVRALGARAMGAPDRETLHAALRERYELQSREKSQATRSEADAALHGEVEAFLAQRPNNSSTPETLTKQFCAGRRGGCSWPEALVALALAFEGTPQPRREPADNERATQRMAGSRPTQPLETCSRVPAVSLDPATFLEQYVAASRPVVLTGLLDDWAAVQPSSSRRWDLDYLWRKAANSTVKAYISPDGEFEAVRRADEVVGGERVCAGCAADEQVLMRPAETEVRLEHFLWLVRGYENPERAAFYLQKHPLSKWRGLGLVEDVTPPPHERLAPFLRPLHELLWLATQCTVGPLHYDEQENLHAMVSVPRCPLRRPALVACAAATAPRLGSRRCVGARSSSSSTPPRGLGRSTTARRCARNTFCGAGVPRQCAATS